MQDWTIQVGTVSDRLKDGPDNDGRDSHCRHETGCLDNSDRAQ